MKGICQRCAENPPKLVLKGQGRMVSGQCKNCARVVAPRASRKSKGGKRK